MNQTKNVEDFKPNPSGATEASRNASAEDFKKTHPHTQSVEDTLLEKLKELHKERERIIQEGKDVNLAIATIGDTLDSIQGEKK